MAAGRFSQELRVGAVIGKTFSTWLRNAPAFIGVSLLFNLPVLLVHLWGIVGLEGYAEAILGDEDIPLENATAIAGISGVLGLLGGLITMVVTGAICHAAFEHLRGERPDMGRSVRRGLSRLIVLLLTTVCAGLFALAAAAIAAVPGLILSLVIGEAGVAIGVVSGVLVMLFVSVSLYPAVPLAAVESVGPIEACQRAWELVKGRRLAAVAVVLLVGLAVGLPSAVVVAILYAALGTEVTAVISIVSSVALASLFSTSQAVLYHDLRVDKEGLGDDDLVSVFS